ncbi:unnamed protein product [Prunus armeniaca]|uniref:Uncharacterized protein n=1 Tax=Prunus armeniaca TaxID=36596 RepID=A0A6J5Y9F8_PRUAR|nr:unnamed protein product [Prunus armeniaca]
MLCENTELLGGGMVDRGCGRFDYGGGYALASEWVSQKKAKRERKKQRGVPFLGLGFEKESWTEIGMAISDPFRPNYRPITNPIMERDESLKEKKMVRGKSFPFV